MPRHIGWARVRRFALLGSESFDSYLHGIDSLSPQWNAQETDGLVLGAWNTAVALGRDLVINGDFANWTGVAPADSPDDWTTTQVGDATSNVTQNPAGQCQIISDGTNVQITQVILEIGKPYTATMSVNTVASGSIIWGSNLAGAGQELINSTGAKVFNFIATSATFIIKRATGAGCDITTDNVVVQQTNILASSRYPGAELYVTANAASDPAGNEANATTGWGAFASTMTSDSTIKAVGDYSMKYISTSAGGSMSFDLDQILTLGKRYKISFATRHLGSGDPQSVNLASAPTGVDNVLVNLTNADTVFVPYTFEFVHSATTRYFASRERGVADDGGAYIDNISIREANPLNGDDTATTVGVATGIPAMPFARRFDAATSFIDIYSAELNSVFNPSAGTLIAFAKGAWDGATARRIVYLAVDANNRIRVTKPAANQLGVFYHAGGTTDSIVKTSMTTADWFMVAITWSTADDQVKMYFDGVQEGLTQTGLGVWVGNLVATTAVIGAANTTPTNVWDGDITEVLLATRALTPGEILDIYQRSGI